jgi:hypothetical protein
MYPDTPVPQEEAAGQNPPDGAIIDYYLSNDAKEVALEIHDSTGYTLRRYTNKDSFYTIPPVNIPPYWIRPQTLLSAEKGSHRFVWDLHYQPLNVPATYSISATYKNTAPEETSPWVLPGNYTVKLIIDGHAYTQKIKVRMDPRISISSEELEGIRNLSYICYDGRKNA